METQTIVDTSAFLKGARGIITIFTLLEYPPAERHFERVIYPNREDYVKAYSLSAALFSRGMAVGAVDVLIASIAINRNLPIVTRDKGFEKIQRVEKKLNVVLIN